MKSALAFVLVTTLSAVAAEAAVVSAGNHQILLGQPLTFDVTITGGEALQGVDLFVRIGADVPNDFGDATPVPGPMITAVDLVGTGLIFAPNNTGQLAPIGALPDQATAASVTTASGTVAASGVLARVTLDTTGVSIGSYDVFLDLSNVDASFVTAALGSGVTTQRLAGSVTVNNVPEPTTLAAAGLAGVILLARRRRGLSRP